MDSRQPISNYPYEQAKLQLASLWLMVVACGHSLSKLLQLQAIARALSFVFHEKRDHVIVVGPYIRPTCVLWKHSSSYLLRCSPAV